MDQAQWTTLITILRSVVRTLPRPARRLQYSDLLIAKLYFWAIACDRPVSWAADRTHLDRRLLRPRHLPSISQLNRRVAAERFQILLQRVHERLVRDAQLATLCIDGRALCVSVVSQDRDAHWGYAPGGKSKGYKLHAIISQDQKIPVFSVLPLHRHEMHVARQMLSCRASLVGAGSRVFADGNYDAHVLHKDVQRRGGWLITRPRGRAKHPVTRRQMGSNRRVLIDLWDRDPALMERVYRERLRAERVFGQLTAIPGLLGPLPAFVRSLARVRRWVGAKICIYHVRREAKPRTESEA